jgi:hypothetical protein
MEYRPLSLADNLQKLMGVFNQGAKKRDKEEIASNQSPRLIHYFVTIGADSLKPFDALANEQSESSGEDGWD